MSMSIGSGEGDDMGVMSEINTTPLVDIMLVLLIIFLITIPVILKVPVKITVPTASNIPTQTKPEDVTVWVDKAGDVFWNQLKVPNMTALVLQVEKEAVKVPQPEIHIRADEDTDYQNVGKVIAAINRGGLVKVGFITYPQLPSAASLSLSSGLF
ncbi:MAG TPA: biopolymer transporter ExbD [Steroidobacteraceae bacterium]|nr:biopolymer transporter ExbD [Steroidobacteraceae bacterium]